MSKNTDFLIFDQATSALDQGIEEEIIREIKTKNLGKTILYITHRLVAIKFVDIIYELQNNYKKSKSF